MVGGHPRNQLTVVAPADCATPIHIECPSDCLDNCLEQYSTVRYGTVQYSTAWCIAVQCGAEQQESTLQQSLIQRSLVQYVYTMVQYVYTLVQYGIVKHTIQQ